MATLKISKSVTARTEETKNQMQTEKKPNMKPRRNTNKTSCCNSLALPLLFPLSLPLLLPRTELITQLQLRGQRRRRLLLLLLLEVNELCLLLVSEISSIYRYIQWLSHVVVCVVCVCVYVCVLPLNCVRAYYQMLSNITRISVSFNLLETVTNW